MGKLNGISLFSNVGIAEAYMNELDIEIKIANEIDQDRARFYQNVYKDTHMICGDITDDNIRSSLVEEAIERNVDFLIATPPCQGMSEAGLRLEFDPRNQLISYAIDVIKRVKPKFVLLENVPKQLTTRIKYGDEIILIPEYIKRELGDSYRFNKSPSCYGKGLWCTSIKRKEYILACQKRLAIYLGVSRKTARNYSL